MKQVKAQFITQDQVAERYPNILQDTVNNGDFSNVSEAAASLTEFFHAIWHDDQSVLEEFDDTESDMTEAQGEVKEAATG